MLTKPVVRLTADQALLHPWIVGNISKTEAIGKEPMLKSIKYINIFKNIQKLKQAVLMYIASQLNSKETEGMRKTFSQIDKNGDGVITKEELTEALSKFKTKTEIAQIIESTGIDKTGNINYSDFLSSTMDYDIFLKKEYLVSAFNEFDKDKNGKITAAELKQILGKDTDISSDQWTEMIKSVDTNGDGVIDSDEFMSMMYDLKKQYSTVKL